MRIASTESMYMQFLAARSLWINISSERYSMPLGRRREPGRWRTRKERRACEKMRKSISMKFGQMLVPCMGSIHKHFDDGKMVPF